MTSDSAPAMAPPTMVPDQELVALQRLLLAESAIQLDHGRSYLVDARLSPVARRYHLPGVAELIQALQPGSPQMVADIIDALTSNDTAFLLTSELVEVLSGHILPDLAARRRPARTLAIWSAACSSGQEPYSLAIVLQEQFPELVSAGQISILASDLSPTMVMRCNAGRYSRIEIARGLPSDVLVRQFEPDAGDWVVRPELRSLLRATVINLIQAWPGVPRCDLVLARNVLGYFPGSVQVQILERIRRTALAPLGYLILGAGEPVLEPTSGVELVGPAHLSCYRLTGEEA